MTDSRSAPTVEREEMPCREEERVPSPLRICFVCTGNTCRSPMAEAVARDLLKKHASADVEVISAGLYANEGEPISPNAVAALCEAGVEPSDTRDYRRHRAHTITGEEAERADLLVGMSASHCMELMMRFPAVAQKITMMKRPISDPYGGDLNCYRACLEEITEGVMTLLAIDGAEEKGGRG